MIEQFLTFYDLPEMDNGGVLYITEPVKFDGEAMGVERENFAMNISYGNEEASLIFWKGIYDTSENPLKLPDGTIIYNVTMGFEHIEEARRRKGRHAKISRSVKRDGMVINIGMLDMQTAKYNPDQYLECKVIQDSERALIKREKSTKRDQFGLTDLKGNAITPVQTNRVFLKAKPFFFESEWQAVEGSQQPVFGTTAFPSFFNKIKKVNKFEINNTVSWLEDYSFYNTSLSPDRYDPPLENFRIIKAKENLSNLHAKLTLDISAVGLPNLDPANWQIQGKFVIGPEGSFEALLESTPYQFFNTGAQASNALYNFNGVVDLDLGNMNSGDVLWFVFYYAAGSTSQPANVIFNSAKLELSATETAVDSVITGVRLIDAIEQNVKAVGSTLPVIAPKFRSGGKYYEQMIFSGLLIRNFTDKPFYTTIEDLTWKLLPEICGDAMTGRDKFYIGQYGDFYANYDKGAFLSAPSTEYSRDYDDAYNCKTFEMKYTKYTKDKDTDNTLDAVHTERQYHLPNENDDNNKSIALEVVEDPNEIEFARRRGITEKYTTALDSDNTIFKIYVTPIEPGTVVPNVFFLFHYFDGNGNLQLSNTGNFNWMLLGTDIGQTITITSQSNQGTYKILSWNATTVILQILSFTGTLFVGQEATGIEYTLSNVYYQIETSEPFDLIEGIENPNNFGNLRSTPRRNMIEWESWLAASCLIPIESGNDFLRNIECTYVVSNGLLRTRLIGSDRIYQENEGMLVDELADPVLVPELVHLTVQADFEDIYNLLNSLEEVNPDGSIGGFNRFVLPNGRVEAGYIQTLKYFWVTHTLTVTYYPKYVRAVTTIDSQVGGGVLINQTGYLPDQLAIDWFSITNDVLRIYDNRSRLVISPVRYQEVLVNGVGYDSVEEFTAALLLVI